MKDEYNEKKPEKEKNKENKPEKKKKLGCCGCLAIFCLVFVLIIGAGVGVGWYFGDSYMKKNFDISLVDAFGVLRGLYKADEKAIVTNAPTDEDDDRFYAAVGESLYLKDGALDSDSFAFISGSLRGETSSSDGGDSTTTPLDAQVQAVRAAAAEGNDKSAIENLINRDNMDLEKIRAKFVEGYDYSGNYEADFTAEVTDRELFSVLKAELEKELQGNENPALKYLTIEQMSLKKSASGNPVVSMVAKLDLRGYLGTQLGDAPEIAKWAATTMLPKSLFVTADVEVAENLTAEILINQMDEKKQANVYKLISGMLKMQGAEKTDAKAFISDAINGAMGGAVKSIDKALDLKKNVTDGKIRLDVYSALASTSFSGKNLSGVELAKTYASVAYADVDKMLKDNESLLFENKWYKDGAIIYSVSDVPGATRIDYGDEFTEEFSTKYLMNTEFYRGIDSKTYFNPVWTDVINKKSYMQSELKFKDGTHPEAVFATLYRLKAEPHTVKLEIDGGTEDEYDILVLGDHVKLEFKDVAALMGVGTSEKTQGLKLEALFDSRKLTKKLGGEEANSRDEQFLYCSDDELRFNLTDKMLARLMAEQTESVFSSGALSSSMKLKFVGLYTGKLNDVIALTDDNGQPTGGTVTVDRKFMTVGFTTATREAFGSGSDMISAIAGDTLGIIVKLDITPGLEDKYLAEPELDYANLDKSRTADMTATLEKTGVSSLKPQELDRQIGKPVRDLIKKMSDTLGSVTVENEKMSVPNVFSLLAAQVFPTNPEKAYKGEQIAIDGIDVHTVLKGVYDIPETETVDGKRYIVKKTGAAYDYAAERNKTDNLNNITAAFAAVSKPDEDLGAVIGYYENGSEDIMYITYDYSLAQYLDNSSSDVRLLSTDDVAVTFVIDKSQTDGASYKTTLWVNDMNAVDRTTLEKMITYFNAANENKFAQLEANVGRFAYQIINNAAIKHYIDTGSMV